MYIFALLIKKIIEFKYGVKDRIKTPMRHTRGETHNRLGTRLILGTRNVRCGQMGFMVNKLLCFITSVVQIHLPQLIVVIYIALLLRKTYLCGNGIYCLQAHSIDI